MPPPLALMDTPSHWALTAPYIAIFNVQTWKSDARTVRHGKCNIRRKVPARWSIFVLSVIRWQMRLWNLENTADTLQIGGLSMFLSGMVVSPDGRTFVSQEYNGALTLWDLQTGQRIRSLGQTKEFLAWRGL